MSINLNADTRIGWCQRFLIRASDDFVNNRARHLATNLPPDFTSSHMIFHNLVLLSLETALERLLESGDIAEFRAFHGNPYQRKLTVTLPDSSGVRRKKSVVPDAVLAIMTARNEYGLFFIEVDRATMSAKRWQDKVITYREYARNRENERAC